MTLEEQIGEILATAYYTEELKLRDISPETLALRRHQLAYFTAWLGTRPATAQTANLFLAELRHKGLARATVRSYYAALRPYLAWLNIPYKAKLKRDKRLPHYHSKADLDRILDQVTARTDRWAKLKPRDRLIITTLARTGLRRAELTSLTCQDIKDGYLFVNQGKGEKDRVVPLTIKLAKDITDYIRQRKLASSDRLFPITPAAIYHLVKHYAVRAGLPDITPHSLRHYFATRLMTKGAELRKVQELLGHQDISTTAIYLDVAPAHLKETIKLLEEE